MKMKAKCKKCAATPGVPNPKGRTTPSSSATKEKF